MTVNTALIPSFCRRLPAIGVILGNLSDGWGHTGWLWIGCQPTSVCRLGTMQTAGQFQREVQALLAHAPTNPDSTLPFHGGVFGVLGYEFSSHCDTALGFVAPHPDWPAAIFIRFGLVIGIELATGKLVTITNDANHQKHWERVWTHMGRNHADSSFPPTVLLPDPDTAGYHATLSAEAFEIAVTALQAQIRQGEFYQANLSFAWHKAVEIEDPLALYWDTVQLNPSPFSAYWHVENTLMISNSPERLALLTADRQLISRPIAGTRGAAANPQQVRDIAAQLLENPKELAEHAMLVDLQRNDLGKVCVPGSVNVSEWLTLEHYSHVTHIVSEVCGQLGQPISHWQVLAALFPGGTITGCPKLRCMKAVQAAEPLPRGWYTGSLGFWDGHSQAMDWNILIRSLMLRPIDGLRYNASIQAGAGIVADSVASHEYRECHRKAALLIGALNQHDRSRRRGGPHPG